MKNDYELRGTICAITIKTSTGKTMETIIDAEDLEKLMNFRVSWHAYFDDTSNDYYVRGGYKGKTVLLHRMIINASRNMLVDHINHNGLDNRKGNLRLVDRSANMQNRKGAQRNSKSQYRGVSWNKNSKKWLVYLSVNGARKYFGGFDDIEEANKCAIESRRKEYPFSENDKGA